MVYTEYIGARMRYRAEQRARRRKHALTIMRNICGVAAFVFFMLVLGKAGASDCGAAWGRNLSFYLVFYRWFCCFGFGGGMAGKTQIKIFWKN